MSSYHSSFTYNTKNSLDEGYIIVAFEPDNGFKDTFLSMENISDDYYDGTKKINYGAKYSSSPEVQISLIKKDDTDISLKEFRECARWLTGARIDSWLDMYVGDTLIYSFLGKFLNMEQYKYDARTTGIRMTFSSVSPWAFSAPQVFDCSISQLFNIDDNGVLRKAGSHAVNLGCDNGVLCTTYVDPNSYFNLTDDGVAYLDNAYRTTIDNQSDDLYTYIYLDIDYQNGNSTYFSVKNLSLNEESIVTDIGVNERILISAKQFIISDIPHKIFGDTFNFIWPRLQPGINHFVIDGDVDGYAQFTYRYPMKIGDCTMDIDVYGNGICCGGGSSSDAYEGFNGTISWDNITNTPTTIGGYGITDAYTIKEVDKIVKNIEGSGSGSIGNIDENELNNMLSDVLK